VRIFVQFGSRHKVITCSNNWCLLFLKRCNARSYRSNGKRLRSITYRLAASSSRAAVCFRDSSSRLGLGTASQVVRARIVQHRCDSLNISFPHALYRPFLASRQLVYWGRGTVPTRGSRMFFRYVLHFAALPNVSIGLLRGPCITSDGYTDAYMYDSVYPIK
jgi:hypothetical protein